MRRALSWGIAMLALAVAALWFADRYDFADPAPSSPPAAAVGGPFTLVDGAGRAVSDADFKGAYLLVSFGFTSCPDICPTALQSVGQAMDLLGADGEQVQPLFITLDPERDTPEVVGDYAGHFHPRLMGLSGTAGQIADVARAYRVYYAKVPADDGDDDYTIDHSTLIYLMDRDGRYLAHFGHRSSADDIAAGIRARLG